MAKNNCKIFCTLIFCKKRQKPASNDFDIIIWMQVPEGREKIARLVCRDIKVGCINNKG